MAAILEQYRIADFLDWDREKRLILNPHFQRGSVWTPAARIYLIDTILRSLPIPKIYLRTKIDVITKKSIREVVDGQQRLRAIIDFADNKFQLSSRAGEFANLNYHSLSSEQKETFLTYPLAVDQLLNANDTQVLEVFARLNSYSVSLNEPEKRHAKYQGEFKLAVHNASQRWSLLWEKYNIFSIRQRVRMEDDSLTAEFFGVLLEGVRDGGQPKIDALYSRYDSSFSTDSTIPSKVDRVLSFILENFADDLVNTPVMSPPHLLMLFAAVAHAIFDIPDGDIADIMPERVSDSLSNLNVARNNLRVLAAVIDSDKQPLSYEDFWTSSRTSTQRIATRRIRFPWFYRALLPKSL